MSRSNPALTNPSQHFFEWKGGKGSLEFYDKEKEVRIPVPLPFEFLVLDELAKVTGYSKLDKSGFYSNEVRNTAKDELTIKIKGQTRFTGLYKNEQGIPQVPKGAAYAKSVYIAHKNKAGEYIMGNITMAGSALGAWIEFGNRHVIQSGKVTIKQGAIQESPVGEFYPPEFEWHDTSDEEEKAAVELDRDLQVYLSQYLSRPAVTEEEDAIVNGEPEITTDVIEDGRHTSRSGTDHDDPEDSAAIETYKNVAQNELDHVEEVTDEPINLEDIPF